MIHTDRPAPFSKRHPLVLVGLLVYILCASLLTWCLLTMEGCP
jgi:hypothetical protein